MNAIKKLWSKALKAVDVNPSTLSGCLDVIVVQQPDNSLKATPFHVRFGKFKLLKCKDTTVKIRINDQDTNLVMKLGEQGEGYFEEEAAEIIRDTQAEHEGQDTQVVIPKIDAAVIKEARRDLISYRDPDSDNLRTILDLEEAIDNERAKIQIRSLQNLDAELDNNMQIEVENTEDLDRLLRNELNTSLLVNAGRQISEDYQSILAGTLSNAGSSTNLPPVPNKEHQPRHRKRVRRIKIKTVRPGSEELKSLNLRVGLNTVTYTVHSFLQGNQTLTAHLYYWPNDANIIVSDVDGTITKTDFLGYMLPAIGKDWSQPGIAPLFSNIKKNDYHLLYLTSRSMGQYQQTKSFLTNITQGGEKLPPGPLIMSPDRMVPSVKRELIFKRPDLFKTAVLKDIQSLFPLNHNPFYAGFGNRETDTVAYNAVGIPLEKIYIVNPKGDIHHHNSTSAKSYSIINNLIKDMFPGLVKDDKEKLADKMNPDNVLDLDSSEKIQENTEKVVH